MADNKKSFLLYCDLIHTINQLPDDKAGLLFKHILSYVNDETPISEDLIVNISFEPIKQQLKRDLRKYESIIERNKINGSKGGRPKNPDEPKKPSGLIGNPDEPKKPDSDTDTDIDNDKRFDFFWDQYHKLSKIEKTDRSPAKKHWNKLKLKEQQTAYKKIGPYIDSIKDKKYIKKARTYLSDKNYNDEFRVNDSFGGYKTLTDQEKERRQVPINWNYIFYKDTYKKVHSNGQGNYIEDNDKKVYL